MGRADPRPEKEQVYGELHKVQKKNARLRGEVNALRASADARTTAAMRREASEYRKALSNILYRLDNGGVTVDDLRSIVEHALALRTLKTVQRHQIAQAHIDTSIGAA